MPVSFPFPPRGLAQRVRFIEFVTLATGVRFSGALTALSCLISKDDGTPVATTNAPVQIGTSCVAYVDLTDAECEATSIVLLPACTNSGVAHVAVELCLDGALQIADEMWGSSDEGQIPGRPLTKGAQMAFLTRKFFNRTNDDGSTLNVFADDGLSILWSAGVSYVNGVASRDRMA